MTDIAVEVHDLTVAFGDFIAVNKVSFTVSRGEVFGFLGANGAGKTTTIRVLCGLLTPTSGDARVAGLGFEDGGNAIKTKVGYMSQRFTLYNDLTVAENIAFNAGLRKMKPADRDARVAELFKFIRFEENTDTLVRDLPGGIKQELSLAVALLHDPEIIFLDEPTAGVSPASRARFWALIKRLASNGKTIFVTTHYMDEAEQCGRIALMRAGHLIALDSPADLKAKSYPEPLYEVETHHGENDAWVAEVEQKGIGTVQPYGLRYHVAVKDADAWSRYMSGPLKADKVRRIPPSLEDVFIRLVEGQDR